MSYESLEELTVSAEKNKVSLFEAVLKDDMDERGVSRNDSFDKMMGLWKVMKRTEADYDGGRRSSSGLAGGDAQKYREYTHTYTSLTGDFVSCVIYYALSTAESNACMRCIVAAPTAGSCGVLPAVMIPYSRRYNVRDERMTEGLYVAAGIGQVIARRASISGAEGGCQAEVGSASAMAAGMLVYLQGGTDGQVKSAVAMALKNLLGLVCDPVAGLVEVPCIKRNVIGAVNAITSADMALAGIKSRIPADEVIDAMKRVGQAMPEALRETAKGGLAATPTGRRIAEELLGLK